MDSHLVYLWFIGVTQQANQWYVFIKWRSDSADITLISTIKNVTLGARVDDRRVNSGIVYVVKLNSNRKMF